MISNSSKIEILKNLINNTESSKYWTEQERAAEAILNEPRQEQLDSYDQQIADLAAKISYFEQEKANLT